MSALSQMSCPCDDDYAQWLDLLALKPSIELLDALGDFVEQYLRTSGLKLYVMGLSGGIDSSFLAALLHSRNIPYLGFCMPIASNTPEEIKRGTDVAIAYTSLPENVAYSPVHDFTDLYNSISGTFGRIYPQTTKIAEGNLKARTRMLFLYHVAQIHGGCVLSTDQLDELLTGFWTLHGDVGDISPIQLVPKSVEYELARILCTRLKNPAPLQAAIDAVPTDGLGISSSDLDQLQVASYADVEILFEKYFNLKLKAKSAQLNAAEIAELQELERTGPIKRFLASGFKRSGAVLADPRSAC